MGKTWMIVIVIALGLIGGGCLARQTPKVIEPIPYGTGEEMLIVPKGTMIGSHATTSEGLWMGLEMWMRLIKKIERMEAEKSPYVW